MRHAVLALVLALAAPSASAGEAAIRDTITAQLDAFAAGDDARAFDYASPGIREMFGTPERFGRMVEQGYPMVDRPGEVTFLGQKPRGQGIRQRLTIRGPDGAIHVLDYDMVPGPGGWRIDGVRLLDVPAVGA